MISGAWGRERPMEKGADGRGVQLSRASAGLAPPSGTLCCSLAVLHVHLAFLPPPDLLGDRNLAGEP